MEKHEMPEEPEVPLKQPVAVQLKQGEDYYYCTCGKSGTQPFCDGSHEGTSFTPLKFTATIDGTSHLCGCKHTQNPPYCDGTHEEL
jgi:CDGSH-type Zn-finger protein